MFAAVTSFDWTRTQPSPMKLSIQPSPVCPRRRQMRLDTVCASSRVVRFADHATTASASTKTSLRAPTFMTSGCPGVVSAMTPVPPIWRPFAPGPEIRASASSATGVQVRPGSRASTESLSTISASFDSDTTWMCWAWLAR